MTKRNRCSEYNLQVAAFVSAIPLLIIGLMVGSMPMFCANMKKK
jgi:hypothetical protein